MNMTLAGMEAWEGDEKVTGRTACEKFKLKVGKNVEFCGDQGGQPDFATFEENFNVTLTIAANVTKVMLELDYKGTELSRG